MAVAAHEAGTPPATAVITRRSPRRSLSALSASSAVVGADSSNRGRWTSHPQHTPPSSVPHQLRHVVMPGAEARTARSSGRAGYVVVPGRPSDAAARSAQLRYRALHGTRDEICSPGFEVGRRRAVGVVAALTINPRATMPMARRWAAGTPSQRPRRPGLRTGSGAAAFVPGHAPPSLILPSRSPRVPPQTLFGPNA